MDEFHQNSPGKFRHFPSVAPRRAPGDLSHGKIGKMEIQLRKIVGWWFQPSEKYDSVGIIPNIWKNKKCPKPPTRWGLMADS